MGRPGLACGLLISLGASWAKLHGCNPTAHSMLGVFILSICNGPCCALCWHRACDADSMIYSFRLVFGQRGVRTGSKTTTQCLRLHPRCAAIGAATTDEASIIVMAGTQGQPCELLPHCGQRRDAQITPFPLLGPAQRDPTFQQMVQSVNDPLQIRTRAQCAPALQHPVECQPSSTAPVLSPFRDVLA